MLRKILVILFAVLICVLPGGFAFGDDELMTKNTERAATPGSYSEGDLVLDTITGVESITGYDYIYSNPPSSDKITITLQNTSQFRLNRYYYYGGLHNCYLRSIMYTGGGFGDNTSAKEIPGDIALVRIADSVINGAGDHFDMLLQIKNLKITPDAAYCTRDPKKGVNIFYYQEAQNPIVSTSSAAYDSFGSTTQAPDRYGRYTVEYEYEFRVVMPGTEENAPAGTILYGSRDFDSYVEGYDIVSGVKSGTERVEPTIYVEPNSITNFTYDPQGRCYRICGTVADENTWRSGFAALFDSTGTTLRWFGFRSLGTTIIGQEAYEFSKYYNVKGEIIRGEGTIDPVDVTVTKGMNVNCVIDPADDYYISVIRLYSKDEQGAETLVGTFNSEEVRGSDPYYVPINNIDCDYRYEVEFEKKYRIDLTVINGIVGDEGTETEATYSVIPGDSQTLTYSGNEGYVLKAIDLDGSTVSIDGHDSSYSFENVQSDHHVTVTYGKKYTIDTSVTNGTITDDVSLWEGESATIEYTPNTGYHLETIIVDGEPMDITQYPNNYSFENVTSNHRIEVVYQANSTLLSKVDESGNILPGAVLQIIDSEGNVLDEWTTGEDNHVIFALEEGDYTLVEKEAPKGYLTAQDVNFTIDQYGHIIIDGRETDKVIMVDIKIHGLPNTGSNGIGFHLVTMGVLLTMLSTMMITRRA